MPGIMPAPTSTARNGTPDLVDRRIVSSNKITPLKHKSLLNFVSSFSKMLRSGVQFFVAHGRRI
jgi:hypothetical protein